MEKLTKMPTWPEFAKAIVRMHLDAEKHLNEAIERGDKKEIAEWRKLVSQTDKLIEKSGITIRNRSAERL